MSEHTTHDGHIYTGLGDPQCICVSDSTGARCQNQSTDIQTGLCPPCQSARYPRQTAASLLTSGVDLARLPASSVTEW